MLFYRFLKTTYKAKDVFKTVSTFIATTAKKIVGVYIDGGQTMFGSRSEFIAKIKKTCNGIRSHCVIHRETLSSSILPTAMKDRLATIIRVVNTKLFTKLCNEMYSNYKTLLFHTSVWWLSKFKLLA